MPTHRADCKAVYVARFASAMTREQARAHWTFVHGPMAEPLHDMVRYVQSHVVATLDGGDPGGAGFDGYACEWWLDRERFADGMRTEAWARIVDDGRVVFDPGSLPGMSVIVDERVVLDGPRTACKAALFARFAAADEARWRDEGAALALRLPGVVRCVHNRVAGALGAGGEITGERAGFDGLAELWFADAGAYDRARASEEWEAVGAAGRGPVERTLGALVQERVIKPHEPAHGA